MTWSNTLGSWLAAIALIIVLIVLVATTVLGLGANIPGWLVFLLIGMVALSRLT